MALAFVIGVFDFGTNQASMWERDLVEAGSPIFNSGPRTPLYLPLIVCLNCYTLVCVRTLPCLLPALRNGIPGCLDPILSSFVVSFKTLIPSSSLTPILTSLMSLHLSHHLTAALLYFHSISILT